jgi:hypothetical protein
MIRQIRFNIENLQRITTSDLPVHKLTLKVGMPVMCIQNLDVSLGICNGTKMVVARLEPSVVWCRVNARDGEMLYPIFPTRHTYDHGGMGFTRTQFPLRVDFCSTINRAQGGTYDVVAYHGLYPIFQHGALFTAITRPRTAEGLSILCDPNLTVTADGVEYATTRNVVHPAVSGRHEQIRTDTPVAPVAPAAQTAPGTETVVEEVDENVGYDTPEFEHYQSARTNNDRHINLG